MTSYDVIFKPKHLKLCLMTFHKIRSRRAELRGGGGGGGGIRPPVGDTQSERVFKIPVQIGLTSD